jgi:L-cysteate sulfo-lyase
MPYDIARVPLGFLPTPLEELPRLSRALGGPRLWVKRDDLTGLASGGSETRKLEYLIADALQHKATTVITSGALQSNHARQTAAAAALHGLQCVLVLSPMAPATVTGNLLLDYLLGARLRWAGGRDPYQVMEEVASEERLAGREPYIIPSGGSNAIGASAYIVAMDELVRQTAQLKLRIDHIVLASSSGGTQAGLVAGARAYNYRGHILGISVDKAAIALAPLILDLAQLTASRLSLRFEIDPTEVRVNDAYRGKGEAALGEPEREATLLAARTEGLLLDPTHAGRALAGLIDLIRKGEFSPQETVLFWNTGGLPAIFAYADQLLERQSRTS